MTNAELESLVKRLRIRVIDYRVFRKGQEISIHVNAIEIVLGLVEYVIDQKYKRAISKEEQNWFNAGLYLAYVFPTGSTEWHDLSSMYNQLATEVEARNYFRT